MEIINPNNLPGNGARQCSTDALWPNHTCYDGGECNVHCPSHESPCNSLCPCKGGYNPHL